KPGTLHQPGPRAAQIFVNYSDLLKAQLTGSIREAILPPLAFVVVHHLTWGRLTDVNDRPPTGSINRELRVHFRLLVPEGRRTRERRLAATPSVRARVLSVCWLEVLPRVRRAAGG